MMCLRPLIGRPFGRQIVDKPKGNIFKIELDTPKNKFHCIVQQLMLRVAIIRASFSETQALIMLWCGRRRIACIFHQIGMSHICSWRRMYHDVKIVPAKFLSCDVSGTDRCVSVLVVVIVPDNRDSVFCGRDQTKRWSNDIIDEFEGLSVSDEDLAEKLSAERSLLRRSPPAARSRPSRVHVTGRVRKVVRDTALLPDHSFMWTSLTSG